MHKRKKKLIVPSVQVRLTATMVGIAAVGMMLQFLFLGARLAGRLADLEGPGGELAQEIPGMLVSVFLVSLAVLLPVMAGLGIAVSFRFAGPLHRFDQYLKSVARGEQLGPCKLRDGDQLQHLCDSINAATEPLRRRQVGTVDEAGAEDGLRQAG